VNAFGRERKCDLRLGFVDLGDDAAPGDGVALLRICLH
jgi:hypothetical protein